MGIAVMEEIVKTIGAILKTLECPICLELLKTPVSAGCGHFFCRECISETLNANYRAPCPLCKRSFTRRSIQEAVQRQSVILAAEALAKTCSSLTGINLIPQENAAKESKKSLKGPVPPAKKLKVSPKEKQDAVSKKRKSCENEGPISVVNVEGSNSDMQKLADMKETNSDIISDKCVSSKKRLCYNESDKEEDSGDFPSLDEIFSKQNSSHSTPKSESFDKLLQEKPLTIIPTDKFSNLRTYSRASAAELKSSIMEKMCIEKYPEESNLLSEINENEMNKVNALKNKTNEDGSDTFVLQEDCFLGKVKNNKNAGKNKEILDENEAESKENEFLCTPIISNESPSKNSNSRRSKRKLNKKSQQLCAKSVCNEPSDEDKHLGSSNPTKGEVAARKTTSAKGGNEGDSECYTLNETPISPHSIRRENIDKKLIDDPLGLTDTAVSVDTVKSPLTSKALSFKSPGWSRVKKVKKDFKVKKFSALQIEKNSPCVSHKQGRQSLDSVVPEQGTESPGISRADQSVDEVGNKKIDMDPQSNFDNDIGMSSETSRYQNIKKQNKEKNLLNAGDSKEVSKSDGHYKDDGNKVSETHIDLGENDVLEKQKEMYEEMSCSDVPINDSRGFSVINVEDNVVCDMENSGGEKMHSSTDAKALNDENATSHIINKRLSSKPLNQTDTQANKNKICQNFKNTDQDVGNLQSANEFNESSGLNTSLNEGKGFVSQKEKLVSKHSYAVYDGTAVSSKDELCSNDITPKRRKTLTLKTQIAEYQRVQTQSLLNEEEGLQYVEHSQQTSQMAFNLDNQNPVYNNFALITQQQTPYLPQQYPPLPCGSSSIGKKKVVKRICLTLDEIQDYFYKSNMNNSSEKICSFPFLSGQFLLDICVSEETLNVSVLKVIDQTSEGNSSGLCSVPIYSDKGIQSSNSLMNIPSPVLPSSNSSEPSYVPEPFPYLNKLSQNLKSSTNFAEQMVTNVAVSPIKVNDALKVSEAQNNLNENVTREDCDMSEIIHFPKEPIQGDHPSQKDVYFDEAEQCNNPNENHPSPSQEMALAATEPFPPVENAPEIGLDSSVQKGDAKEIFGDGNKLNNKLPDKRGKSPEFQERILGNSSDSDKEASLKKLQQCVDKELRTKRKKISRLSLKKKSIFKRAQLCDSSDESDAEQDFTKNQSKEIVGVVMPEGPSEIISASKKSPVFKEPGSSVSLENAANSSVVPENEMTSTLNSMLSEDAPEANTSGIIMEIEDLSDKIKFLEDKLKQCGHVEGQKSESTLSKGRKTSPVNSSAMHESDSEDSNDLFPQSVPPTPPETCGQDGNSSYKSSFYKTC